MPVLLSMTRSGWVTRSLSAKAWDSGAFWPLRVPAGLATRAARVAFSRMMLVAAWSVRRSRNTEWRICPARVHSPKDTSATSTGLTQCRRPAIAVALANGLALATSGSSLALRSRSRASLKPVPTLPAYCNAPLSSCTPSSNAPIPVRAPLGSVKPQMTNSWRWLHLSLIQSTERRDW